MSFIVRPSSRNSRISFIWMVGIFISVFLAFSSVYAADKSEKKVYGEVKNDMALVYFFWQPDSNMFNRYVFADDQFVGFLQSNAYCFSYVAPGRHLIWYTEDGSYVGQEVEFVPGQTYYIDTGDNVSVLRPVEGKALLEKSKYYYALDAATTTAGVKKIKNDYPLAKKYNANIKKASIDAIPIATAPADLNGLVTVPQYTPIKLQLMENLSSASDQNGETVWFRILDDVTINNSICFKKGTPVQGLVHYAQSGKGFAQSGFIDVTIPAVQAVDGSLTPVVGQVLSTGRAISMGSAVAISFMFGLIGEAATKGKEAFEPTGQEIVVWTRSDSWINPEKAVIDPTGDVSVVSSVTNLKATAKSIRFSTVSAVTKEIPVVVETNQAIKDIAMVSVNGTVLIQPCKPLRLKQTKSTCEITFKGWDLVRYIDLQKPDNSIQLRGILIDGTLFTTEFKFEVEQTNKK